MKDLFELEEESYPETELTLESLDEYLEYTSNDDFSIKEIISTYK